MRIRVACLENLPNGDVTAITVGEREVALFRVDSAVYATDNHCTHGAARLCDGFLEGFSIECPLHQGAFDIRDGAAIRAPAEVAITTYPVEIDNGEVYLTLSEPVDE